MVKGHTWLFCFEMFEWTHVEALYKNDLCFSKDKVCIKFVLLDYRMYDIGFADY